MTSYSNTGGAGYTQYKFNTTDSATIGDAQVDVLVKAEPKEMEGI